ncbi:MULTISPECIES: serine/threonine-protein kinase [unclassified Microcoleus]|uniref:serine/threonine-protein kinase n=1 Tax=unclassified Microcoleus TaxID=2642155 RepID=UPI002FCF55F0
MLKLIDAIDQGGFGDVDLVEDQHGQQFARKTFAKNQPLSAGLLDNVLKRFKKEARIQKGISHPNIVPVLGGDFDTYPPYYLMPVAADSLAKDLEADRTLGGKFVAAISDIVSGLEELHSMQIYHRDLKPANVLRFEATKSTGGGYFYAISDFGLISMKESQLSVLTKTGMRKGSDSYTAPEIVKDLKRASAQSDIYSLGCILHDMVGTEDRVPCWEIREPGEFSAILLGCTRKDPAQRFKSVRAVLDAILSVEFTPQTPPSQASINFIATLEGPSPPDPAFWDALADFLENEASGTDRNAVLGKLGSEQIQTLCAAAPGAASRIGISFAEWVHGSSFNWDYCDALANRLEEFISGTDFEAKVDCLMALLQMGTSHNRWFVERKFVRLCGPAMDDSLAKRLGVQFRIAESDVCDQIAHLERSISESRNSLHPALVKALSDVCS